ncbi:MAG: hypothetical protein JXA28_03520 [Bacteroidetes bacterium]|nr:hypothetical protein [Bacteroidota bacterium]
MDERRLYQTTESPEGVRELNHDAPIAPAVPPYRERNRPVFTGLEDHSIALEEAGTLTHNYRMAAGRGAVKGRYFSRTSIEQILMQEDVVGIRYYYAKDSEDHPQMVLVGVDAHGQDLTDGFIIGNGLPVSRFHEQANPLNA